jgi:hypothetical protein
MKVAGTREEKSKGFSSWFGARKAQPGYQSV